jgi:NAD+ kinase
VNRPIGSVVLVTHGEPAVAGPVLARTLELLEERAVEVVVPPEEWTKHAGALSRLNGVRTAKEADSLAGVGLCLVLGGDGTMLRAFRLTRGLGIPVAGINLGRVGFLTTVAAEGLQEGVTALLEGRFRRYPLLGLRARLGSAVHRAANDVVVSKGDRSHACSLALTINGVALFEVLCDGVVVATPAGSSAYSLAAGGPLLGIAVDAYVISLVAPHAVGVRPVVAAPGDVLEVRNVSEHTDCYLDVDGQRSAVMSPGALVRIQTEPADTVLALLEGDSLYHHVRDRLL